MVCFNNISLFLTLSSLVDYDEPEEDEQSNDHSDSAITKYLLAALAKVDLSQ